MSLKTTLIAALSCWGVVGLFYLFYVFKVTHVLEGVFRELLLLPAFAGGGFFSLYSSYLILKRIINKN